MHKKKIYGDVISQYHYSTDTGPFYNWFYLIALFFANIFALHYTDSAIVGVLIFISIIILSMRSGSEVDITKMQHRDYKEIPRIYRWGKWKPIVGPESILISKTKASSGLFFIPWGAKYDTYYDANIITTHSRDPLIIRNTDRNQTLSYSKFLAKHFNIKIQEKVSGGYIWLEDE